MHKTLERQLVRIYGKIEDIPKSCQKIFEEVSKTYNYYDKDHDLIERSLEISSAELTGLLEDLSDSKKIVEQKVVERTAELSQEKSKLNQIAENMLIGAILLDGVGDVLFVNQTAKDILEIKNDDLENALEKLFAKFESSPIKDHTSKCFAGKPSEILEIEDDDVIYEILFRCLSEPGKGIFGHLIWIRDITDEKMLERSKSELVAVASHQLRTPLTVTKGNIEMLLDESFGKLNEEQKKVVLQTADANNKLIALVNEMLDITKIEKQKLEIEIAEIDLGELIENTIVGLDAYATRHKNNICYDKPKEKIPIVMGDTLRIQQIFQNLIENAIQYNKPTGKNKCQVDISISVINENVEVTVTDTGIGIPLNEQSKIFERFYRASNAVKFASSGTGLGLYIAKSILEKLGGSIHFESQENVGTTFFLDFPISKVQKKL
jgi:two-component system, OmpR family, phosphate regulon sensor histidine kinase PhoR